MAQHFSTPTQETQHIHCINENSKELRRKLNEFEYIRKEYRKAIEKLDQKLQKKIDDLRLPVTETAEYQIKELTEQLNKAKLTINNLNKENRNSKDEAELSQAQQEKEKLKLKLKDANKKYLQKPLEKGELRICDNDCVLCSLLWICHHKLQVYPCGRHLEKILTIEAERKYGTNPVDLCCEKFMDILRKCGIVVDKFERKFLQNKIDKQIDEVWQKLLTVDAKKLVVMVGMEFPEPGRLGHVIVCDLKSRDKGTLEYNDLQNDVEGIKVNEEAFKKAVRNNKGISLFTVDTDELAKKINDHKDILHTTNYKANPTGTSSATTKHGVCNTSAADDTEHAAAYVRGSLRAIPITEQAAGDTERAARNTERAACDTNSAACDTERAACDAERAVCNTDSAAYDAESGVLGL